MLPILGCSEGRCTESVVLCCDSSASSQNYSLPQLVVAGYLIEVAGRKKIGRNSVSEEAKVTFISI